MKYCIYTAHFSLATSMCHILPLLLLASVINGLAHVLEEKHFLLKAAEQME